MIPPEGRQPLLEELHNTHLGVSKMKALARSYILWSGMDGDIKNTDKFYVVYQNSRPAPAIYCSVALMEWPSEPWSPIQLDFAGPFLGQMYLLIVDATLQVA